MRPTHHPLADRVRAHISLRMLARSVEWHMRQRLAPLLFDDEAGRAAGWQRGSVVAPARRSALAERKARTQATQDGLPVHGFSGLLKQRGTRCMNRVRAEVGVPLWFDQLAEPTPLQRRAFELLDAPIKL